MFIKQTAVGGFVLGVMATITFMAALGADKPDAQPAPEGPRFQISSWSMSQKDPQTGESAHGAYRLDTQTGVVYEIIGTTIHVVQ